MSITLILGGARAGKSSHALHLAEHCGGRLLFVATAEARDEEMRSRIDQHRAERSAIWETLEAPRTLARALDAHVGAHNMYDTIVVDCLTLWTSNLMETVGLDAIEDLMRRETTALLGVVRQRHEARWILVSNEVGLGIVPDNAVGRAFRDALGRVNQMVAAAADEVSLMVAGIEMRVK